MALKRRKGQRTAEQEPNIAPPAPEPEAQAGPAAPLLLVARHHDWVEPNTHQRFEEGVPTEPVMYTEWLKCQVTAGNIEVV